MNQPSPRMAYKLQKYIDYTRILKMSPPKKRELNIHSGYVYKSNLHSGEPLLLGPYPFTGTMPTTLPYHNQSRVKMKNAY